MSQGRDSNVGGIFILPVELRVCLRKTKRKKKETGRAATLCTSFDRCVVVATEIAPFQKPPPLPRAWREVNAFRLPMCQKRVPVTKQSGSGAQLFGSRVAPPWSCPPRSGKGASPLGQVLFAKPPFSASQKAGWLRSTGGRAARPTSYARRGKTQRQMRRLGRGRAFCHVAVVGSCFHTPGGKWNRSGPAAAR